jgi:thymidylate synthase (FAD)
MKPVLKVLARPSITEGMEDFLREARLTWVETSEATPAERLIEFAGRICYMSFGTRQHRIGHSDYISNLIAQGHESVLEHACWTVLLSDVSRAFTHQLVRHRVGFSFSQLSQQYHDESDADFVAPFGLDASPLALTEWQEAISAAQKAYNAIKETLKADPNLNNKEANRALRSAARSILPNATATKIVVTANARSIRNFLLQRGAIEGDYEMRAVSKLLYDMMLIEAPSIVADFECKELDDKSSMIVHM